MAAVALAGDASLYAATLRLVDDHYLWPERIDHASMFRAAAVRLESRVEPVMVAVKQDLVRVEIAKRTWTIEYDGDLVDALVQLEDAVIASGVPLADDLDVRAELLKGCLSTLDRHTIVLAGEGLERFDERLSGTLSGIGVTLRLGPSGLVVAAVYAGTPAARSGVAAGDKVRAVDGVSTSGMTPADATVRIRGRAGTRVTLRVERAAELLDIEIERGEVTIPNVTGSAGPRGVGVVRIEHFSEQTVANLDRVLAELRAEGLLRVGLIVDLRGNTGGSLSQSAKAADTFVDAGRIVTTTGRGGARVPGLVHTIDARLGSLNDVPVAVLVDHETASGAEILAGALMQLDRASLIGETTFGKGTVQTLYQVADGIKLKLTVAEYTLAGDRRVNEVGIVPDLALYAVKADEGRFWYPDAARLRSRLGPDTPLLHYPDLEAGVRDDAVDLAASILTSGTTSDRSSVLAAEAALLPTLRALQSSRLDEALRSGEVDWRPAPAVPEAFEASVGFAAHPVARAGERTELRLDVVNAGAELFRAAVRLRSTNPDFDDLVVPIGHLAPGESRTVATSLAPRASSPSRVDRVVGVFECDGCTAAPVLDEVLTVEGTPAPSIELTAERVGEEVRVTLHNRGGLTLTGVRAHVPFPDLPGVELLGPTGPPLVLTPGATVSVSQTLRLAPTFVAEAIDLRFEVEADGYPNLVRWKLPLPRSGAVVSLNAPTLELAGPRNRQLPGVAVVRVSASDPDGLAHIVVFAGSETVNRTRWNASVDWEEDKVLYRTGLGQRARLSVNVPVAAGSNRIVVIAEDKQGNRTRRELYIHGDGAGPAQDGVAFSP